MDFYWSHLYLILDITLMNGYLRMKARVKIAGIDLGIHEIGDDGLAWVQNNLEVIEIDDDTLFNEIIDDMEDGLKQFGEYTFCDKGPDEVMSFKFMPKIKKLTGLEARALLEKVSEYSDHGETVANSIVMGLDHMPEDWFDDLLSGDILEY